jgi:hypothetical protein
LIDQNLVWLIGADQGRPSFRIKGEKTVRLLLEFIGLDYLHGEVRTSAQRIAA